jgi:hypothetical protein
VVLLVRHLRESYRDSSNSNRRTAAARRRRAQKDQKGEKSKELTNFKKSESRNMLVAAHLRRSGGGDLQCRTDSRPRG